MEEPLNIRVTPKGIIFLALGGYMDKENALSNTDKVIAMLVKYLAEKNKGLISINGKLEFADINSEE